MGTGIFIFGKVVCFIVWTSVVILGLPSGGACTWFGDGIRSSFSLVTTRAVATTDATRCWAARPDAAGDGDGRGVDGARFVAFFRRFNNEPEPCRVGEGLYPFAVRGTKGPSIEEWGGGDAMVTEECECEAVR